MSTSLVPVQNADSSSIEVGQSYSTFVRNSLYPVPVTMLGKIALGWEVVQPLELSIVRDTDGSYIVSDDIFNMYGQGVTALESVRDYLRTLIEYYQYLSDDTDDPSVALFRYLQTYLQPITR